MAEIVDAREFALDQLIMNTSMASEADDLAEIVSAALR